MSDKSVRPLPSKSVGAVGTSGTVQGLAPVAPVAAAKPAQLFGGHKGGGRRRTDGLIAGSEAAKKADLEKDSKRKRDARQRANASTLAPPLPSAPASAPGASLAPPPYQPGYAGPVAPVALPPGAGVAPGAQSGPAFVPWSEGLLIKPAKLLVKILDRLRMASIAKRVKNLMLPKEDEKQIMATFDWQQKAVDDFASAAATAAAIELNERRIGGSRYSHLVNLGMCGGELLLAHTAALSALEKLALERGNLNNKDAKTQS